VSDAVLTMNPFADVHVHPQPTALPIAPDAVEVVTVKCPVRRRGLLVHELTAAGEPELFAFFLDLVERGGEIDLDSDAPVVPALVRIGFLVEERDIVDWPRFRIALEPVAVPDDAPADRRSRRVADTFLFQDEFALHPGMPWPAEYGEQEGLLGCFAAGPAIWLGDPAELTTPYWVDDEAAALLAGCVPGQEAPRLPASLAASLERVGALVPRGGAARRRALDVAGCRDAFAADRYAVVPALLAPAELAALGDYYRALLAAGLVRLGDRQNDRRHASYNDPIGRFVHARLAPVMSAVVARPVLPAFSFFASYVDGAVLEAHRDRPEAEYSISMQIDYAPRPSGAGATGWPLRFASAAGDIGAADLRIGDAVFYHGRELVHRRDRLPPGHRSSHLILEYVPDDFQGLLI
jgi:hypothetical protein